MTDDADLALLSQRVGAALKAARLVLATAESCTGGWVAKVITDTAGSSAWFAGGLATYSNRAKVSVLGVSPATLERHGAVSEQTAAEMVAGALRCTGAEVALSVTGIAGPDGGSADKPVGTVCFAWGRRDAAVETATCHFNGDREAVRRASVVFALEHLLAHLAKPG